MWQRFTERARRIILLAQEEAAKTNSAYVGTEHLLIGLTRESEGVGAQVLHRMGVTLDRVRQEVEAEIELSEEEFTGEPRLTPRSKRALELAADEARRFRHNYIGTEHLLLALLREKDGVAANVLRKLGLNLNDARQQVLEYLSSATEQKTEPGQNQIHLSSGPKQHPYLPLIEALIPILDQTIVAISENDAEKIESAKQKLMALRDDLQQHSDEIK